MGDVVRRIGLSLGADLCWPLCYEHMMERLDLAIPHEGDTVRFDVRRLSIEPFDLRQPSRYDLVIDRLTHWLHSSREWIKKAVLMDDLYVFNNPWSIQSCEKHTSYCAMIRLGMPIPTTWMIPAKSYELRPDLRATLHSYARLFDLGKIGDEVGWPMFLKPYDGGGWREVTRANNAQEVWKAYEESGRSVMHAQASVEGFDKFVRCIGFGPQTHLVDYDPTQPLHDRYTMGRDFVSAKEADHLRKITLVINAFFGWEFNSCEALRKDGVWHPIDFANACPDSQVTSLHYHFPWLVGAYLRWSIYCATVKRKMPRNLDWQSFFDIAAEPGTFDEKLDAYAELAEARLDKEPFEAFCAEHLGHLDEELHAYFGTTLWKETIREKVVSIFPSHEVDEFTDMFWERTQQWRRDVG